MATVAGSLRNKVLVLDDVTTGDLTVTGSVTISGTATTLNSTNTSINDHLIELNAGLTGSNPNDTGLILERGTTGNNVFIGWDESADKVVAGLTTSDGTATGNLTLTYANFQAASATFTGSVTATTIDTGQGATEVYLMNQNVRTTDSPTFNTVTTTNNGSGTNVRIGDDAWIGDINVANTIRISGVQNANNGYITFGNSSNTALGRAGTGQLTWGGDTVWYAGNDGSGSGLDADTVDGINGASFLRSDTADTATGNIDFARASFGSASLHTTGGTHGVVTDSFSLHSGASDLMYMRPSALRSDNGFFQWQTYNGDNAGDIELQPYGGSITISTGSVGTSSANGLRFQTGSGSYSDGRYQHRFRKQDKGGGIPLYIDISQAAANSFTELARFGTYTGNNYEFEVQGDINATGNLYDSGNAVWHTGNDGSGSGLDADTLDGINSGSFLRSDAADTATGNLTFTGNISQTAGTFLSHGAQVSSLTTAWQVAGTGKDRGLYPFRFQNGATGQPESGDNAHWGLNIYAHAGSGGNYPYGTQLSAGSTQQLWHRWWANGVAQSWRKIWDTSNDGSGSGLDADLLDGQHGSYYAPASTALTTSTTFGGDVSGTYNAIVVADDSHNHNHSDGNFTVNGVLQAGAGSNHISTSSAPFRWQRSSSGQTGQDDNVSVYVDDSNIYFTHNNDADGDASGFNFRYTTGGVATNLLNFSASTMTYKGNLVWHAGNDGSGSGLDADLLDGISSGSFARSDASDTLTGVYTFSNTSTAATLSVTGHAGASSYNYFLGAYNDGGNKVVHFVNGSTRTADGGANTYTIRNDGGSLRLGNSSYSTLLLGSGDLTYNNNEVWHAGNDGSGSGLDADLLDGINSGSFLRSDTADTATGRITLQYGVTSDFNSIGGTQGVTAFYAANVGGVSNRPDSGNYATGLEFVYHDTSARSQLAAGSAGSNNQANFYVRSEAWSATNSWTSWYKLFHTGNDGSGSGLDADTVDGVEASSFARTSAIASINMNNYSISNLNDLSFNDPGPNEGIRWIGGSDWRIYESPDNLSTNSGGNLQFTTGGTRRATLNTSGSLWTSGQGTLWGASNDGSGSGLDADLLDGQHGSYYQPADTTIFRHRGTIDVTSATGGSNSNPFDDAHTETKVAEYGTRLLSYTGASATMLTINTGGSASVFQIGAHYNGNDFYMRTRTDSSNWQTWKKLWHAGNDGSGSGLDADLLDGQHGSYYATASGLTSTTTTANAALPKAGGTMTGTITSRDILVGANYHLMRSNHHSGHLEGSYNNVGENSSKSNPIYTIGSSYNPNDASLNNMYGIGYTHTNASFISMTGASGWGMYVAADGDARIYLGGGNGVISSTGQHYVGSSVVWNAGNDGSGSGLDADTVDGKHKDYLMHYKGLVAGNWDTLFSQTDGHMGVYEVHNITSGSHSNYPTGAYTYGGVLSWQLDNSTFKMYAPHTGGLYIQNGWNNDEYSGWRKVWDSGNDGSGSGLDADLLDGQQGSYYLAYANLTGTPTIPTNNNQLTNGAGYTTNLGFSRYNASTTYSTYSNRQIFYSNTNMATSSSYQSSLEVFASGAGNDAFMSFHVGSDYAIYLGLDGGTNKLSVGGWSMGANSYEIYHSGNKPSLATLGYTGATNANYITNNNQLTNGAGYITSSGTANQSNMVTGSAFATTGSPSSVLEYQQAASITDTKLAPSTDWHNTIRMGHGNPYSYYSNTLAMQMTGTGAGRIRTQLITNNTAQGWRTVWDSSNDGSGSGLDADLLDGIQASGFVNQNGTYTLASGYTVAQGDWGLRNTTPSGWIQLGPANTSYAHIYTDRSSFYFNVNAMYQNGNLLWAANNDGSGSGLDSDLLDGQHGSYYARKTYWPDATTQLGASAHSLTDLNTTALWSKPAGYQTMVRASNSNGLPSSHGQSYFGYTVTSRRDTGGGYSALLTAYDNSNMWFTYQGASTAYPTWRKLWHDGNDGSGSGLDADTLDGVQLDKFLQDNSSEGDFRNQTSGSIGSLYLGHTPTSNTGSAFITCVKQTVANQPGSIRFLISPTNTTNSTSTTYLMHEFQADGDAHHDGDVIAYSTTTGSDRKLKENIRDLEGSLDKTLKLRGVKFDWKDEKRSNDQLGFIAQEVEEVLPEVVKEVETLSKEGETHLTVNYPAVVPLLVEAIKEQQSIINRLEERLSDLENKLK